MAGKKHKVQGLRRRWLTGSMGPVLVILLLVGVLISVGFASNYYNSARSTLRAKAAAGADYFNTYVMTSYREYYRSATIYAAAFDDSDKIELQFLNSSGRVEVTTRGVTTGTYPSTPEILRALESGTVQDYIGRDSVTGERILAVSGLLKFNGQVVGVMRYRHREHRPAGAADGPAGGRRHAGGGGADRHVQHDLHQQCGGPRVRRVRGGQTYLRRQLWRADTQQVLR